MESGPAGAPVRTRRECRVTLQLGTDTVGVAENDRCREAVAGDRGGLLEHTGGSNGVAAGARLAEIVRPVGQPERPRVHLLLQSRPAREPVFAGQRELSSRQGERGGNRSHAGDRVDVPGLRGAQQVPGLMT